MVNTRNANLTPAVTIESLQEQLQQLQQTIANMLTHQNVVNLEIEALKNGKGTNTEDVKGWVYRCKQFFKIDGIEEARKVELASMHLFGAIYEDPIVDLKNLKQEGSVQQYQESFEALLNKVELHDAYVVSLFIGGLKKEVSMPIRMFKITTLSDVYAMAKMQEATNAVLKTRYNPSLLPTPKFVNKLVNAQLKSATMNGGNQIVARNGGNRPYRLTQKELKEKRAKNKCFYCDQKYFPGHKCSGQLYSLEVVSEDHDELVTEGNNETFEDCVEEVVTMESNPQISLNALSGLNSFQTMRVKGETFTSDVMLLPLGGCEMVLGIQWLATLGDIQCNFQHLTMKFEYNGRRMVLRGTKNFAIHWMQGKSASKGGQIKQAELASMVLCIYPVSFWQMDGKTNVTKEVDKVLAKFERVFEIPTELSPQRSHDHQIPLMPNTPPINVRPYRHPPNQKDAIELMVKELQLNNYIVKDKFPIPVIEELIDEINGYVVYIKLDLRSGAKQAFEQKTRDLDVEFKK
ncbi:hypothetical protein Tco_0841198 [Tanacetum coccineum]|uniref:Ty3 transposon capsid-like protein domain-containing protein n=1 Tax=Tanacetum coccineum TaxID=301880 RepID=A0ABQ5AZZ1_9ASTR